MSRPKRPEHLRGLRHIDSNRVVEQTILGSGIPADIAEQIDYSVLDPETCKAWAGTLRDIIASLTRMALALEARADGSAASTCHLCGSRFYPSRSDARYCSGRCRMRAHRNSSAAPAASSRPGSAAHMA